MPTEREIQEVLAAIQTLRFMPESERTEYYDSVIAPRIEEAAATVQRQRDEKTLAGWLAIQSAAVGFAVEGISDVTFELFQRAPEAERAAAWKAASLLPPEQYARVNWLLREFRGEENLPPEVLLREAARTAEMLVQLAGAAAAERRPTTGVLGEFIGTRTFTSTRNFPVVAGTFTVFTPNGDGAGSYETNTGGGARDYRRTNGPVPPGAYRISNHRANRTTVGMALHGVGYSFDVDETDGTEVFGRSLFRIHPDGGSPGTNGCLGIRESEDELRACESAIINLLERDGAFKIIVRY